MSGKITTFVYAFLIRTPVEVGVVYKQDEDGSIEDFEIVDHRMLNIDCCDEDRLHESVSEERECLDFIRELSTAVKDQR